MLDCSTFCFSPNGYCSTYVSSSFPHPSKELSQANDVELLFLGPCLVLGKARTFYGLHCTPPPGFYGVFCLRPSMLMLFNNTVNTLALKSWPLFACETLIRIEKEATQGRWLVAGAKLCRHSREADISDHRCVISILLETTSRTCSLPFLSFFL